MTFANQAQEFMQRIQTRHRNPVRAGTARIYQSYLDAHILSSLGHLNTRMIENGVAKKFVASLTGAGLAPATINQIFNVVKAVVASAVDRNGNELYPRKWNPDFIDLPIVSQDAQNAPIVTPEQVNAALLAASGQDQAMLVLLAATGLRIGEVLALQGHLTVTTRRRMACRGLSGPQVEITPIPVQDTPNSYWDPMFGIVHVKSTLVRGRVEPQPKTESGRRQVDLHPDVNAYLRQAGLPSEGFLFQNARGTRVRIETMYDRLEDLGITEGFHAFRRFRATHLESQNVPRSLVQFWLGHRGTTITDRYIRIGQDLQTRRDWATRAGLGFEIPKI
jgi:integrase